jgi:type IV secretion system protein VirB6
MPGNSFPAPFTAIDLAYKEAFELYIDKILIGIENVLATPLLACVTLWVIVQGILVMRGDIDARRGVTKLLSVALVIGLVSSASLYHDYVDDMFREGIPELVQNLGGNFGLPKETIPMQIDVVFRAGEAAFQQVASQITPDNELDAIALDGAQFFFFFTLWSIFGIYDIIMIMMSVLVSVGPLFIIGFLFESTAGITTRWVGQLVSYSIMLLLVSIIASVVVSVLITAGGLIIAQIALGATSQDIIILYELDFLILTGNALVVAVPAIASSIGGGVGINGSQMGQSISRRLAHYVRPGPMVGGPSHQIQSLGNFFS